MLHLLAETPTGPLAADAVEGLQGLDYVVVTSVDRDDVDDHGSSHISETVRQLKLKTPHLLVEVLTPDFMDDGAAIDTVLSARPEIFNHNLETIRRLTPEVRSVATYDRSLSVLRKVKEREPAIFTKSGIMLGLGETEEELHEALCDLREAGVNLLTLGQYLQPSKKHLPVVEFIHSDTFADHKQTAEAMGFTYVASGPLVRSSYHADDFVPEDYRTQS